MNYAYNREEQPKFEKKTDEKTCKTKFKSVKSASFS